MIRVPLFALVFLCASVSLFAAPQLRLSILDDNPLKHPVWVTSGTNGSTSLAFHAYNGGDGALDVQATGSTPWLSPQVDAAAPCPFNASISCRRIRVLLMAASLADGTYEGTVTVTATAAWDAPQTVPVKIYVGGNVPPSIHLYVPPTTGASDFIQFQTQGQLGTPPPSVTGAGTFLTVSDSHNGSFRRIYDHRVTGTYQNGSGVGDKAGSMTVAGSIFAADNGLVPVTLHVTNSPIGQLSQQQVTIEAAEEVNRPDVDVTLSNRGSGALTVTSVDVETDDAGTWLSTEDKGGNTYAIRTTVDGLVAGLYQGTVTINSNAANSPHRIRVVLRLAVRSGPLSLYRGAVNGANFQGTRPLAPGVIASVFGSQFADATESAPSIPLPNQLSGVKVLVDGVEAPLFFVSYGQVNFQVPYEVGAGSRMLQIMRDGQMGNSISVTVGSVSAGIFRLGLGSEYGAIRNPNAAKPFPYPVAFGQQHNIAAEPAQPGDVLEIYATGLGPLDRAVTSGAGAPNAEPLARALVKPMVRFSDNGLATTVTPDFVGLSPNFVGLFQVNAAIPINAPPNEHTPVIFDFPSGGSSNRVEIAVQ